MKQVFAGILCLLSTVIFGQEGYGGSTASANGAAAAQFGNTPVGHYTGTPSVNIPITSISDGDLSLPIGLSYHGSGIKVNQVSSSVGLGWKLNAGGSIVRYVRGVPDEKIEHLVPGTRGQIDKRKGWNSWADNHMDNFTNAMWTEHVTGGVISFPVINPISGQYLFTIPINVQNNDEMLSEAYNQIVDTEPDLYVYNFGGYSGKFTFDNQNNIVFLQSNDLKIEKTNWDLANQVEWTITTPDGTKYKFGGNSATEGTMSGVNGRIDVPQNLSSSTWHLHTIESFDHKKSIHIQYVDEHYGFQDWATKTIVSIGGNNQWESGSTINMGTSQFSAVVGKRISQITTKSGEYKILFDAGGIRQDLNRFDSRSVKNNNARSIAGIEVYYANQKTKEYRLKTSYFNGTSVEANDLRLKLDEVYEVSGSSSLPGYKFYYEGNGLPNRLSYARDHWGYYNGANSNQTLLPRGFHLENGQQALNQNLANRDVNPTYSKYGVLNKMILPTGGAKVFEYESHQQGNDLVGGLRIKSIALHDIGSTNGLGIQLSKSNYQYSGGIAYSGIINPDHYYISQDYYNNGNTPYYRLPSIRVLTTTPRPAEFNNVGGGHMGYSKVIVDNGGSGSIEYSYRNKTITGVQTVFPFAPPTTDPMSGLPISIKHLGVNNDVISETIYEYQESNVQYIKASKITKYKSALEWEDTRAGHIVLPYIAQRKYQIKTSRIDNISITTINDGVETKLIQTFNTENHNPSKISFRSSDGTLHEREYKYAHDYSHLGGNYTTLINSNRIAQPLRTILKANGIVQGGSYTEIGSTDGVVRSQKFGSIHLGGTQEFDSEILGSYNSKGLPTSFREIDNVSNSLIYNKYNTKVIASVQNAEASEIAFTSFETTNGTGGWSYSSSNIESTPSILGTKAYRLNSQISKYVPRGNYILAFWVKGRGTLRAGSQDIQGSYNWTYHEVPVNNTTLAKIYQTVAYTPPSSGGSTRPVIDDDFYDPFGSGGGGTTTTTSPTYASYLFLDEVRLFPADAQMNSTTYNDRGLPAGVSDVNSRITYYNYDEFLRLKDAKDQNGHIISATEYNTPIGGNHSVMEYIPQLAYTSASPFNSAPVSQVLKSQVVFDGLGRNKASAALSASPSGKDIIQFSSYDGFGKMNKNYMGYTGTFNTTLSATSHISNQQTFYNTQFGTQEAQNPYSEVKYESDLSNRVEKQAIPGKHHKMNSGRAAEVIYRSNSNSLDGMIYDFGINGGDYYPASSLSVTVSIDPDGRETKTFKDNMNRTIVTEIAGLQTYYIYDLRSKLVAVLPPETVAKAKNYSHRYWRDNASYGIKAGFGDEIFWYQYDSKGRLQRKHVPGSEPTSYTYDILDRIKETVDGNGNRNWVEYDILSRVKKAGIYVGATKVTHNETFYDNYDNGQAFETKTGYSYNYFPYVRGMVTGGTTAILNSNGTVKETLKSTSYFDEFGRNIYSITDNSTKRPAGIYTQTDNGPVGADRIWAKYDFTGKILNTEYIQNAWVNNRSIITNIKDRMTYDAVGRPLGMYKSVNNQSEVRVTGLAYDELGRVKEKALHKQGTSWQWSTEVYDYDLLGRMKSQVNRVNKGLSNDLFRLNYYYENSNVNGSYSGNLSRVEWSTNEGLMHHYNYQYDDQYRLISADYDNSFSGSKMPNVYDLTNVSYDDNGNIMSLLRYDENGGKMDNLLYTYTQDKSQLTKVEEGSGGNANKGFISKGTGVYQYDDNGNLTRDPFKKVTISYNHLDKPTRVYNDDGKYVDWVYDASGNTVSMKSSTESTARLYVNGFEYYGNNLASVGFGEGRIKFSGSTVQYEYHITDHLGNTRVAFTKVNGQIQINQENHYYPFGLEMNGSWNTIQGGENNNYKYNGIEKVEKAGLNNYFAFYRTLDPAIGRWWQIDPVAAKYGSMNPYVSMGNNPVNYNDPMGDDFNVGNGLIGAAIGAGIALLDDGKITGGEVGYVVGGAVIGGVWGEDIRNMVIALFDENSSYHGGDLRAAKHKGASSTYTGLTKRSGWSGLDLTLVNALLKVKPPNEYVIQYDKDGKEISKTKIGNKGGNEYDIIHHQIGRPLLTGSFAFTHTIFNPFYPDNNAIRVDPGIWDVPGSYFDGPLETLDGFNDPIFNLITLGQGIRNTTWSNLNPFRTRTFDQYKKMAGGQQIRRVLPGGQIIWKKEFHHMFITQRFATRLGIQNTVLVNNGINVWRMNTIQHAIIDKYRYQFLKAGIKPKVGLFKEYNLFYRVK